MNRRLTALVLLSLLAVLPLSVARGATGDAADVSAALGVVNQIRAAANLPSVTVNTDAGTDATATARYSVLNNACLHNVEEDPSNQYATPQSTYDWGAQDQFCSMSGPMSFQEFSNAFMTLPYHSVPFVSPLVTQVGFGYYQAQPSDNIPSGGLTGATDFNFVYSGGSPTYPVLFPANGQTYPSSVTPIYGGGEDPDPLANCAGYSAPTGAPLVAQFATTPNVSQVTLSQGSSTVPSCWFTRSTDANHALIINTLIVLPKAPLSNGTYSVCVQFSDGTPSVAWTFGVGGAPSSTTASCAGQASGPPANFTGTWSTDWYGNLTITQTGNQVTGTMPELSSGGLTGTVTGNVLQGTWQNDLSNPTQGIGLSVTISADGTTFAGNTDNNSYLTPIHGTRTTPVPASPQPTPTPAPAATPSVGQPVYAPNTITIQSGNNQQLALNSAGGLGEGFAPLSVGGLAPGVSVTFTCSAPPGVLCNLANSGGPQTVPSNANGIATLSSNGIGIYSQGGTGTLTIRAAAPGYASATFSETVLAPPGASSTSGNGPVAALTPVPPVAEAETGAPPALSWSGVWGTTAGVLQLSESGSQVNGVITIGNGPATVTATASGNTLNGTWKPLIGLLGGSSGTFQLTASADGNSFTGSYTENGTTTQWSGQRAGS